MISATFRWQSAARTDQGNVRDHNEDACLDRGDAGFWVVADGMGGHEAGDFASRLIVERLGRLGEFERASQFVDRVEDELLGVNRHLYEKSQSAPQPTIIGSTVVSLLALDAHCVTVWAGDSRVYLLRDGSLTRVSRDHSEVEELVAQGLVHPDDAESHPQANVITRAVGGAEHLYLDYELRELADGDRYMLCSDGLYKDVSEAEMAEELKLGDCTAACNRLIELALSRECLDNVTVLVVDFEAVAAPVAHGGTDAEAQEITHVKARPAENDDAEQAAAARAGEQQPDATDVTAEDDPEITQPRPVDARANQLAKARVEDAGDDGAAAKASDNTKAPDKTKAPEG